MNDAAKDFAPIAGDYDFFMTHSSEAEHAVRDYLPHLQRFASGDEPIEMLDFGCGAGDFSEQFLRQVAWPARRLRLTLLEPVQEHCLRAVERLQAMCTTPIGHTAALSDLRQQSYDLILANHVFYYVPKLEETLAALVDRLSPDGLFLAAVAGHDNGLIRFWEAGFAQLNRPIPYWVAEDVEQALRERNIAYHKEPSRYELAFADSRENRLKILRFLCAEHLAQMRQEELLELFDDFARNGRIEMQTLSWHFVISGRQ